MFIGYGSGVKGYKLWNPETSKSFMSRSVVFNESVMYFDKLSSDILPDFSEEQVRVEVEHSVEKEKMSLLTMMVLLLQMILILILLVLMILILLILIIIMFRTHPLFCSHNSLLLLVGT